MSALEATRQRARYEHARLVLGRVVQACAEGGVDALPVKGILTAGMLYADPVMRPFQDVDLRVRPRDLDRVQRLAARAGWPRLSRSRAYGTLSFDVLGFLVEFETHVGPPGLCGLAVEDMIARAARVDGGDGAKHLEPELHDHLLLLCVNAFKDKLTDALPGAIRDLELLPSRSGFQVERLAALARDAGATTIVRIVATWLIDQRLAGPWDAIRAALGPSPRRALYNAAFAAAIARRPPRRPLVRLLARLGADRRSQRVQALGVMGFRAIEDAMARLADANDRPRAGIESRVAGSPSAARMPSPR